MSGYRRGLQATGEIALAGFGLDCDFGQEARTVETILSVGDVRQKASRRG